MNILNKLMNQIYHEKLLVQLQRKHLIARFDCKAMSLQTGSNRWQVQYVEAHSRDIRQPVDAVAKRAMPGGIAGA